MWIIPRQLITSHFAPDTKVSVSDSERFGRMCEKSLMWRSKPSQSRTWRQRLKRVGYIQHLYTRTLNPSLSTIFLEKWMSSVPDSRVSRFPKLEDETQLMIRDIYTHTSLKESPPVDQLTLFSKTSKESSQVKPQTESRYSNMSSETWKKEVISHRGEYSARLKLVRPINEKESLSWPTARNSDAEGGRIETEMSKKGFRSKRHTSDQYFGAKLRDAVETHEEKNWPTPRTGNPSSRKKGTGGKVLNEEVKNWATPNTMDYLPPKEGEAQERIFRTHRKGRKEPCNLREQVNPKSWPIGLPDQDKSSTSGKNPGRLNPNWVEQVMGLPFVGWTQLPTEWID